MTASAQLLTDAKAMAANTPNATTLANATNPNNILEDIPGSLSVLVTKVQELKKIATDIQANLDAGDPSKTTMTNFLLALV